MSCRRVPPLLLLLRSAGALPGSQDPQLAALDMPSAAAAVATRAAQMAAAAAGMLGMLTAHFWQIGTDDLTSSPSSMAGSQCGGLLQRQQQQLLLAAGVQQQALLAAPAAAAAAAVAVAGQGHAGGPGGAAASAAALAGLALASQGAQLRHSTMAPDMLCVEAPLLAYSC